MKQKVVCDLCNAESEAYDPNDFKSHSCKDWRMLSYEINPGSGSYQFDRKVVTYRLCPKCCDRLKVPQLDLATGREEVGVRLLELIREIADQVVTDSKGN